MLQLFSKRFVTHIILGALLPLAIAFILLHKVIIPPGIPFYGDDTYYVTHVSSYRPTNWIYSWDLGLGTVMHLIGLFNYALIWIVSYLIGQEAFTKFYILLVASLPAVTTYLALHLLASEWKLFKTGKANNIFASVGGLFVLLLFSNFGLTWATAFISWSYAMLPISFALFVRYIRKGLFRDLLLLALLSIFAISNPFWIFLIALIGSIYLLIELAVSSQRLNILKRSWVASSFILAFNAFWLVPTIAGYTLGAGGLYQEYTTEKLITLEGLRFLSFWNLLDVIMLGEHEYFFFWLHPQNYGPLNAAIPVLIALSILISRKNRYVLFMSLTLLVGIFLTKGVHEPGGYLYYLIAKNLPYGAGAILRNPTKFVPLVAFTSAFLVGMFIAKIYERLSSFRPEKPNLWSSALKYGSVAGLALLVLSPITYGTLLYLQGYTWPRYKPVYVPQIYNEINSWLSKQPENFKVMWIPSGGAYIWKPYIITRFPDLLSSKPAVSFYKVYPEPLNFTDRIGDILALLGVKYVIYHGDSINYPNEEIFRRLLSQKDLKIVLNMNYTYLPEDDSKAPLPIGSEGFQFSGSPFSLVNPKKLDRGKEVNLTLRYEIPKSVSEQGYKGKFWAGFNIAIDAYPAGSTDLTRRVFINEDYITHLVNQTMIDDACGYATYRVKVPNNYPGTAVDIYARFYDGCFKPLTPSYFIARLPVFPKEAGIPFIVMRNEKYVGPIYPAHLALTYNLEVKELLRLEELDLASWIMLPVNESTPQEFPNAQLLIHSSSSLPKWLDEHLRHSDMKLLYTLPISQLNLPIEEELEGPYNPNAYVYDERPLVPLSREFFLERGREVTLNFSYYLPKPVLDGGYKGKFWAGFGIRLWGYPHGIAPPPEVEWRYRVFESFISTFRLISECSGYATFNITIPEEFRGSSVDIYANFYDCCFKPISPVYYIGTFKIRGITLFNTGFGSSRLHIINSSLPVSIYVPRDDNYTLMAKASGILFINGTLFEGNAEKLNLNLKRGAYTIELSSPEEAYIEEFVLFNTKNNIMDLSQSHREKPAELIGFEKINPVKWEVTINASTPFTLVFTEPYDPLWRAYVDGREVGPLPHSIVNTFSINQTGILHITIYYTLQTYYNIGVIVSSLTAFLFILATIIQHRKIHAKKMCKVVTTEERKPRNDSTITAKPKTQELVNHGTGSPRPINKRS